MAERTYSNDDDLSKSIRSTVAPREPEERGALAQGYRLRAEVLRLVSGEALSKETSGTLQGLAENYDFMATTLERISAAND